MLFNSTGSRHKPVPLARASAGTGSCEGPGAVCSTIGTGWSHQPVPIPGFCIWHRVMVQTGSYAAALEPVCTSTRCQLSSTGSVQGQRYQLLFSRYHWYQRYRLQQQLVPLAWTFGPFLVVHVDPKIFLCSYKAVYGIHPESTMSPKPIPCC